MNNLQDMFKHAEGIVQDRLDGLPVFGNYKEILKQILGLNEELFEMLYDDDTENIDDYDLEFVNFEEALKKLKEFK